MPDLQRYPLNLNLIKNVKDVTFAEKPQIKINS